MCNINNKSVPPTLLDFESPHMPSRMVSSSQVHPEVELVLSHQYLGSDQTLPSNILAQIQSAIINQETEKTENSQTL